MVSNMSYYLFIFSCGKIYSCVPASISNYDYVLQHMIANVLLAFKLTEGVLYDRAGGLHADLL